MKNKPAKNIAIYQATSLVSIQLGFNTTWFQYNLVSIQLGFNTTT